MTRLLLLGATSEIGLATARVLAPERAVLAGRTAAGLAAAAAALPGVAVETVEFDAADTAGVERVVDAAFAAGPVDVVLPAFGILGDQTLAEREPGHAAEVLQVDLVAQAVALLAAARHLRTQGSGTLVVFSSIAAVRGRRANYVYGAAKAGLDALATGLTVDLAEHGVHVVLVRPGFVVGRMTEGMAPAPLSTTPGAVAAAVVAAIRRRRRVVWVPRRLVGVAAGLRVLPWPLWRRLPR